MSLFITIEGGEGSGKTSVGKRIVKELEERGYEVVYTREPGGIEISEAIREIILDKKNTNMDARTEALLFAAARRQHIVERIIPSLKAGKVVICDRFLDSSLVYQGITRGIGIDEVYRINEFAIDGTMPDLTLFLKVYPQVGLNRIFSTNRDTNRLDHESYDFHNKVYEGYLHLAEIYKDRIVTIDSEQTIDEVCNDAVRVVLEKLAQKK